ncbi:hypothetical protein [Novipirellula rosea]|uniref:hypothetical protein n=1 Tax=Novipirellula rosea TaxID=1031540 RepID=UPI0031ECF683
MKHWSRANGLSAATANSPDVRRTLRNRSRYEVANNSYARGITLTLANDVEFGIHVDHLAESFPKQVRNVDNWCCSNGCSKPQQKWRVVFVFKLAQIQPLFRNSVS